MSKLLTVQEQNDYRRTLENLSKDELNELFNTLAQEQDSKTWELDEKTLNAVKEIFGSFKLNQSSQLAGGVLALVDRLNSESRLSFYDMKILQKVLIDVKWNTLTEAKIVFDALKGVEKINIELMNDELKFRHISEFIERETRKEKTGLEFKEGDAQLAFQAENESMNKSQLSEAAKTSAKLSKV